MDNTTLTIIGMIAAFLTASITPILTEAVKNDFQHRTKLQNLRIALYKEMYNNYSMMRGIDVSNDAIDMAITTISNLRQHAVRLECYEHTLQNEMTLFYELKESQIINGLQGFLMGMIFSLPDLELASKDSLKKAVSNFVKYSATYRDGYTYGFYKNNFDRKILKSIVDSKQYQAIIEDGEEVDKAVAK
jgi:hypothetical protein